MEMNNKNDMPVFIDNDLEPYTLLHDIICNWWVIVLGAIAGALLTYVVEGRRTQCRYSCEGIGRYQYAGAEGDDGYSEEFD